MVTDLLPAPSIGPSDQAMAHMPLPILGAALEAGRQDEYRRLFIS